MMNEESVQKCSLEIIKHYADAMIFISLMTKVTKITNFDVHSFKLEDLKFGFQFGLC